MVKVKQEHVKIAWKYRAWGPCLFRWRKTIQAVVKCVTCADLRKKLCPNEKQKAKMEKKRLKAQKEKEGLLEKEAKRESKLANKYGATDSNGIGHKRNASAPDINGYQPPDGPIKKKMSAPVIQSKRNSKIESSSDKLKYANTMPTIASNEDLSAAFDFGAKSGNAGTSTKKSHSRNPSATSNKSNKSYKSFIKPSSASSPSLPSSSSSSSSSHFTSSSSAFTSSNSTISSTPGAGLHSSPFSNQQSPSRPPANQLKHAKTTGGFKSHGNKDSIKATQSLKSSSSPGFLTNDKNKNNNKTSKSKSKAKAFSSSVKNQKPIQEETTQLLKPSEIKKQQAKNSSSSSKKGTKKWK